MSLTAFHNTVYSPFRNIIKDGVPYAGMDLDTRAASYAAPVGYELLAEQNQTVNFAKETDVAYGANGKFFYKKVIGDITFNDDTFGDPLYGISKAGYIKKEIISNPVSKKILVATIILIVAIAGFFIYKKLKK